MLKTLGGMVKQNWGFALFVLLMFASRSSIADWYHVPSGSMLPTIEIGDRIFVDKMAYRLELPFTDIEIAKTGHPQRGDIVVIQATAERDRLIKRIIGLPGDQIAMRNNQLVINGTVIQYKADESTIFQEDLFGITHKVQFVNIPNPKSSFTNILIPEGQYFVMGDNRNNSQDSRYFGFVSEQELQGKASHVVLSFDRDNYYLPKMNRKFKKLI
ncbi:signal peptidase I [Aliiglaciecola sp. LCG003]|uniref:signal peptidase I n=1 Tax=Aliiglaciecola sp. LCG003 TaxID=3053655 RepID=UPI002574769D|nr:signal peptidase I [Aliiglaciecola sp. LCG003]WJG08002.1 signal peptidase I [Aliiglaciecola sp. LCG003]